MLLKSSLCGFTQTIKLVVKSLFCHFLLLNDCFYATTVKTAFKTTGRFTLNIRSVRL